jgi:hypothetical protein
LTKTVQIDEQQKNEAKFTLQTSQMHNSMV